MIIYSGPSNLDGKPIVAIATGIKTRSANEKTGNLVQVYILPDEQSPLDSAQSGADKSVCGNCVHRPSDGKLGSCYVDLNKGPCQVYKAYRLGSYRTYSRADHLSLFAGRKIRLGAYGDPAAVPVRVWREILSVADGWTGYTHQWRRQSAQPLRAWCMASCDSDADRAEAQAKGWRTFRVMRSTESLGTGEFSCPASEEAGKRLTCSECMACGGGDSRKVSPAIYVHGLDWKKTKYNQPGGLNPVPRVPPPSRVGESA